MTADPYEHDDPAAIRHALAAMENRAAADVDPERNRMETITVVLGGRPFAVSQLAIRADAKWRELARPLVEPIAEMAMASGLGSPTPERMVKLAFASALFVDPMATLNAVLAYAPALEAERDWIEEHAVAQEALAALLALFFGMGAPTSMPTGAVPAAQPTTLQN